jgi:type IV pilus assembly protein PilM
MLDRLTHLLTEPPPDYAFELSEKGIAWARPGTPGQPSFETLDPEVLAVSPLRDNVLKPEALRERVGRIAGANGSRKRRRAVLILPDFCARVAVLDFDTFPKDETEQMSLVRFRMKRSVPFDFESAMIRYHPQTDSATGRIELIVVAASLDIIARYEAPFRSAGLHAGHVTTSTLAALELDGRAGVSLLAKLTGRVLSAAVLKNGILRMLRTVELHEVSHDEIMAVLFPTTAYVEDELETRPERLLTCGLETRLAHQVAEDLGVPSEPLKSRWGTPAEHNAGLLGYLESVK